MTGWLHDWLIPAIWVIFWGYWFFADRQRQADRTESAASWAIHLSFLVAAFALVFFSPIGLLADRFLPNTPAIVIGGVIVCMLGLSFAVWARLHLGKHWSGAITIKDDHRLIRTGPYAVVRHPIYTGILADLLGTAIASGELHGMLAVAVLAITYIRKIRLEEKWLMQKFGSEYSQYRQAVRALIPLVM